jgi:hypothetical protein
MGEIIGAGFFVLLNDYLASFNPTVEDTRLIKIMASRSP